MGLYLCVFDEDNELEGVDVGSYSDFEFLRKNITERLEPHGRGSKFPTMLLHSDSDGEWSSLECLALKRELVEIINGFQALPAIEFHSQWQQEVGNAIGLKPVSLNESLIDVDGEPVLDRILRLCEVAIERDQAILFQ